MTLSAHTLMMAIKATAHKLRELQEEIKNAADPELSYLEAEMDGYVEAEMELKGLYLAQQRVGDNLPPYEALIEE